MIKIRIILILSFLFLTIIAIIFFVRINDLFLEAKEVKKELIILNQRQENIIEFKKNQDILNEKINKVESVFVDLKTSLEIITFLEQNAEKNDLFFNIIIPQTVRKEERDHWESLRIQITLKGEFLNFMNFLQELENSKFLLDILNITIYREKEGLQEIEAVLLIKIFGK